MGILTWILLGLVAGAIAKFLMPGKDPGGWVLTIVLGIGGAVLGGYIGSLLGWGTVNEFSLHGVALAVGGSMLLLLIYRMVMTKQA